MGYLAVILLPTSAAKLLGHWQGLYEVIKRVGKVNYLIRLHNRRKKDQIYHVNMLRKWHMAASPNYFMQDIADDYSAHEDTPSWDEGEDGAPCVGTQLDDPKREDLDDLLAEFKDMLRVLPGKTTLVEHWIDVGDNSAICLPPYRLPQAYQEWVRNKIMDMLEYGIIEASSSDWAAPIVPVKKKDGSIYASVLTTGGSTQYPGWTPTQCFEWMT